jgi:hypothetical protein
VTKEQTAAFGKCWDSGGIKIILDNTSLQFATDFANVCLRSFVQDMADQVKKVAEAKIAAQKTAPPAKMQGDITVAPPAPVPQKSSIILTD